MIQYTWLVWSPGSTFVDEDVADVRYTVHAGNRERVDVACTVLFHAGLHGAMTNVNCYARRENPTHAQTSYFTPGLFSGFDLKSSMLSPRTPARQLRNGRRGVVRGSLSVERISDHTLGFV